MENGIAEVTIDKVSERKKNALASLVEKLIDSQNTDEWKHYIWRLYEGYMNDQNNGDKSVTLALEFYTFRDLIRFFEDIEAVSEGREVNRL
jgi:hypothetical protein